MRNLERETDETGRPQVTARLHACGALPGDRLLPALGSVARSWQRSLSAGLRARARGEAVHRSA